METITVSKKEYEEMMRELERLRKLQEELEEDELLEQVQESLADARAGRITKA